MLTAGGEIRVNNVLVIDIKQVCLGQSLA